jgi:hypothetical protein
MNDYVEANNDKLWLNEGFRRQYPLTAQTLKELAEQQHTELVYRQYTEIFQSLHDAIDSFSAVRVPDFSQKYLHEQDMSEIPGGQKSNELPGGGMLEGPVSKALDNYQEKQG